MSLSFHSYAPGGAVGGDKWGYLHFEGGFPSSLTCGDRYVAATKYMDRLITVGPVNKLLKPMHLNITYVSEREFEDVQKNG